MRLHDAWEKNFTFYKKKQLLPVQSKLSFSVINWLKLYYPLTIAKKKDSSNTKIRLKNNKNILKVPNFEK